LAPDASRGREGVAAAALRRPRAAAARAGGAARGARRRRCLPPLRHPRGRPRSALAPAPAIRMALRCGAPACVPGGLCSDLQPADPSPSGPRSSASARLHRRRLSRFLRSACCTTRPHSPASARASARRSRLQSRRLPPARMAARPRARRPPVPRPPPPRVGRRSVEAEYLWARGLPSLPRQRPLRPERSARRAGRSRARSSARVGRGQPMA
jgi:hypothetical protein